MATKTTAALTASAASWITAAAIDHPSELPQHLMLRLGITRRRAQAVLQQLVAGQWLTRAGSVRKPLYRPGALRQVVHHYPLAGLQEDAPWRRDFVPYFDLPVEVRRMAQHAFTELLNNAVDHSGGTRVTVSLRQTPLHLQLLVSDDGCGLFERIAQSFAIDDPQLAMFELSKGKLTSEPERHSGHGLFFASRLADIFDLHANSAAFQHRHWGDEIWRKTRPAPHRGTSVYLAIALDTPRTLDSVLRAHSAGATGYGFDRTDVALKLLGGPDMLMSRADARRVTARLTMFGQAELDFSGIDAIGHGFADELFRVFRREHPEVNLQAKKMAPAVGAMVGSITG
jgi:anti-sigma regulatory factor (Ser/Thr protein kinase)